MAYVIPQPPQAAVPVRGGGEFPVRRIFCVGRNYAAHAREMGADPDREPPFFFTKPADAILTGGADMPYPPQTADLHHEVELVVAIGTGGANIPVETAKTHIWGYAAGLDMTRRDLQGAAKKAGKPWDMGKGFDHSAPIGAMVPAKELGPKYGEDGHVLLNVNGEERQSGDLADMIWSIPEIVATLSTFVTLAPGDLIMTGTPEGVAAVTAGDVLEGIISGLPPVTVKIV
ncbi:fumarylacetoacetate hydrolase family protein [Acidisoma silvae]|uniref:Fumarylacetoacetate hydrolase family protein n=1 Tax=Acidisoma silvae TaxID=2802396 RepID=A0A963YP62_9PROT|nr:fumarylacetoacetate hydrolase family protein [Acidisoma silvae]MCB8874073.1 fumarylacetoacetate hydrolase family protein [Acidisoma silvae]